MRKYLLAIERRTNDYIPLAWSLSISDGTKHDIYSLKEIDDLTSSISEEDLKERINSKNLIDEECLDKPLVIIFEENERIRKLESSIVTMDEKEVIEPSYIYNFLLNNIRQRQIMNRVYNKFKDKKISSTLKIILEHINGFQEHSNEIFEASLSKLFSLPYKEVRELGLFIKRDLEMLLSEEKEIKLQMVENKNG